MSALDHRSAAAHGQPAAAQRSALPQRLGEGTSIVIRPLRRRDLDDARALAARAGVVCDELELSRLVRSPSERLVLCASAPIDGTETLLGLGVIELSHSATMPSLVLVDPAAGIEIARLLAGALIERARELAGAVGD